jgi:5-methyltetrahydropteroyltriglutamate--homocysteine methyltransferase
LPLRGILDSVGRARSVALLFEVANPRHEHDGTVIEEVKLPGDKILILAVIDSTTNYVEHSELVAQRLIRFAEIVGRERVIPGTDCGFWHVAGTSCAAPLLANASVSGGGSR